jgi:GTP pyrophosphokinase
MNLADGVDADWVDLSWDPRSMGATARLRSTLQNKPGTLAELTTILADNAANIINLRMAQREDAFHVYEVDLEVRDLQHLMQTITAIRASDASVETERV